MTRFTHCAILNWIINGILFHVSTEPTIKDYDNATIVLVNVFIISAMMSTMTG